MPTDSFKPKGPAKGSRPESGGANVKNYPVIGVVKDNIDANRSGVIRVALEDGKGAIDPSDSGSWTEVKYLSTFFGSIGSSSGDGAEDYGSYKNNPSSYGQWQAPPDIGTKVVCIFINGDLNAGYYIGAVVNPDTLQMVPAIGASDKVTLNEGEANGCGGATRLPVTNLNTNNKDKADSNQYLDTPRPVHSYTTSVMSQQGIIRDPVRGPISSSASREAISRVGWGVSTPGRPIYEGGFDDENLPENLTPDKAQELKVISRRGGHSIVMDDGDIIGRDQLIRIRTSLGHQILVSDDGQTLLLLHSNGQSYIELGKEGTVDIFSTNSINMRTSGDFNIHADRDINLHAMENLNLQGKNIHTNSEEVTQSKAGNYKIESLKNFTVKAARSFAAKSGGQASVVAGSQAFLNGLKVNLNSGSPSVSPSSVPFIPLVAQTDTLFDEEKGWAAAPGKLLTTVSRAPAHFPWANAGMGVDIKTSGNASDNLPKASSSLVQKVNNLAANSGVSPPNVATVASVPTTKEVSAAVNKTTTEAVLGAVATSAATGETAPAVTKGAAIVPTSAGGKESGLMGAITKTADTLNQATQAVNTGISVAKQSATSVKQCAVVIGSFAQSPDHLVQAGLLKPGSATLVNGLASAGKSITNAIPNNLFTGKSGVENVSLLVKNTTSQAESMVDVMQSSQKILCKAGLISGKESNTQTAGLVTAASTAGAEQTANVVKQSLGPKATDNRSTALRNATNTSSAVTAAIDIAAAGPAPATSKSSNPANMIGKFQNASNQVSGYLDKTSTVMNAIGSGNAAANLADTLGGLGGIANALKGMSNLLNNRVTLTGLLNSVKGVVGSAYSAIINGFPKLEANVPQYLTDFAKQTATKTAVESSKVPGTPDTKNKTKDAINAASSPTSSNSKTGEKKDVSSGGTENTVNNTVAGITGSEKNTTNKVKTEGTNVKQPNKKPTVTLSSISNTLNQASNVINDAKTVTGIINKVTGKTSNTSKVVGNINRAVNEINGLAGAAQSLNDGLTGLQNAAKSVQAGGGSSKASLLASGVSNIPGGIRSVSNVVDRAAGAINAIPGTELLSGKLRNTVTDVQNGLADANRIINNVENIANSLGGLSKSISSKLPLGEASQLLSSLTALGSGSGRTIRLPQLGFNTSNRFELTAQINNLLADIGIPRPKFLGEILPDVIQTFERLSVLAKQQRQRLQEKVDQAFEDEKTAQEVYINAMNTLPEGDPTVEILRKEYINAKIRADQLLNKLLNLDIEQEDVIMATDTGADVLEVPELELPTEQLTIDSLSLALNTTSADPNIRSG